MMEGSSEIGRRYCKECYEKKLERKLGKNKAQKVTGNCEDFVDYLH
jgi:hypothetical protein